MDRDCPHGLGDGNSHLRRNAFLDLVPNSDGLVPASSGRLYVERDLFSALCHSRGAHLRQCSRGYGLYYAITLGSSAIAPLVYGVVTDSLGLVFTMVTAGLFVLLTLPLSLFLASK